MLTRPTVRRLPIRGSSPDAAGRGYGGAARASGAGWRRTISTGDQAAARPPGAPVGRCAARKTPLSRPPWVDHPRFRHHGFATSNPLFCLGRLGPQSAHDAPAPPLSPALSRPVEPLELGDASRCEPSSRHCRPPSTSRLAARPTCSLAGRGHGVEGRSAQPQRRLAPLPTDCQRLLAFVHRSAKTFGGGWW